MIETTFESLWLSKEILQAIEEKGYKTPSSIQAWVIPIVLNTEKDLLWQAQTGSWKTRAFWLPILDKIDVNLLKPQSLILCPTRELAIQLAEELKSFCSYKKVNITLLYWGQNIRTEIASLSKQVHIVVWTPWRVIDHLNKGRLNLNDIKYFVLDEADEMLNVWFKEEIEEILKFAPKNKRVFLFSATMPSFIQNIVRNYMNDYEVVNIKKETLTNDAITQIYYDAPRWHKFDVLCRILDITLDFYWIIFCKTKAETDDVASKLSQKWYLAEAIHWDIDQSMREKVLNRFKKRNISILVATDVAARWIDINDLSHVVNFELPDNPETYAHRIWRTWRAWKSWIAISLVSRADLKKLFYIERLIKTKIKKEKLPSWDDIVLFKKEKLFKDIQTIIDSKENKKYNDLWRELIERFGNIKLITALLRKFYKNEFEASNYIDFTSDYKLFWGDRKQRWEKRSFFKRNNWMIRLFVAKWKMDWFRNPWNLLAFIAKESWLLDLWVWKVDIFKNFSYVDMPEYKAKVVLNVFKEKNYLKPLVVKAKEKSDFWWSFNKIDNNRRYSNNRLWNKWSFKKGDGSSSRWNFKN